MHIPDEDAEELREYVKKQLRNNSDADPEVLAEYVVALLQADDAPESQKRVECEQGLAEFLKGDVATKIVDNIFQALRIKSYKPSYKAPSRQNAQSALSASAATFQPVPSRVGNSAVGNGTNVGGRKNKRSYNDIDSELQHNGRTQRSAKQAKRESGAAGPMQLRQGQSTAAGIATRAQNHNTPSAFPGMPNFDANDPASMMAAMQSMMQAMAQFSAMMGMQQQQQASTQQFRANRTGRCYDYDNKGFCAKGSDCPYEHGDDKVVYAPLISPLDHSSSTIKDARRNGRGKSRGKPDAQGQRSRSRKTKGHKRSDFSAFGDHTDSSNTKIVVENIPEAVYGDEAIIAYFVQFGEIEDVEFLPSKMAAIITFDSHKSASEAKHSREAVFGDRFVRTFWYKMPDEANEGTEVEHVDPAELRRRIQEAQEAHESKLQKLEELRIQRQELEQKMREHAQKRRKLMQALRAKEKRRKRRQRNGGNDDTTTKSGSDVDVYDDDEEDAEDVELRNKLAALEAEAELLGLDPDDPHNNFGRSEHNYTGRGRGFYQGRGRGLGAYRGRYAASGGRGGAAARSRCGVLRLDNRTRSITISVASGSADDERMRQLILTHYEVDGIEPHPNKSESQIVTFKQRFMAEDFATKARDVLEGDFKLSWYDLPRNSNPATSTVAPDIAANDVEFSSEDDAYEDAVKRERDGVFGRRVNASGQRARDRDLDVADDDDDNDADDDRFMN